MVILKMREHNDMADQAARWFHSKWGIPVEAYKESINVCLKCKDCVPQWYVAILNGEIVGGIGVIENDFHDRKDLSPNVCTLYVEKKYRCNGIAEKLLQCVCTDMNHLGVDTLYLTTDHHSFYERYGWEFFCMVQGEEAPDMIRMYIHKAK